MAQITDGKIKSPYISSAQITVVSSDLAGTGMHNIILDNSIGIEIIMLEKILVKSLDLITLQNTMRFFLNDGSNIRLIHERIVTPLEASPSQETSSTIIDLTAILRIRNDEFFINHVFWGLAILPGMSLLCSIENIGLFNMLLTGFIWEPGT